MQETKIEITMEEVFGWANLPLFLYWLYWVFLMLVDKDPWWRAIFLAPYFSILPTLYLVFFGKNSKNPILKKLAILILLSFLASTIYLVFEGGFWLFFSLAGLIPFSGYIICLIIFLRFREKKVIRETLGR